MKITKAFGIVGFLVGGSYRKGEKMDEDKQKESENIDAVGQVKSKQVSNVCVVLLCYEVQK